MVQVHPGPPIRKEGTVGEEKKGKKKFFLFAMLLAAVAAIVTFFKRRRGQGIEESEWQELPPPEGG
jgi:hypothetical protein